MSLAVSPISFKSDTNLIAGALKPQDSETTDKAPKADENLSQAKAPLEKDVYQNETQNEHDIADVKSEFAQAQKKDEFAAVLNDRKWEKKYLPESDLIYITQKHSDNSTEYILEKDGTVKEAGADNKPVVIMEANKEMAEKFGKIKAKQSDVPLENKSTWMNIKEKIADFWKFMTVSGTMANATVKGVAEGFAASVATIAAASVIRGSSGLFKKPKANSFTDIFRHPMKTAGKAGKITAFVVGAGILAANLLLGKLEANEKSAVVEHKVDVPHVN